MDVGRRVGLRLRTFDRILVAGQSTRLEDIAYTRWSPESADCRMGVKAGLVLRRSGKVPTQAEVQRQSRTCAPRVLNEDRRLGQAFMQVKGDAWLELLGLDVHKLAQAVVVHPAGQGCIQTLDVACCALRSIQHGVIERRLNGIALRDPAYADVGDELVVVVVVDLRCGGGTEGNVVKAVRPGVVIFNAGHGIEISSLEGRETIDATGEAKAEGEVALRHHVRRRSVDTLGVIEEA